MALPTDGAGSPGGAALRPAPLAGVRVLDLTRLLPGPMATLHLADLGAEVIKIEDPGLGDYARTLGQRRVATTPFFLAINRNKRFVTLDLKDPAGRERFLALVDSADVVIEGFRPGVMARLGLDYEALKARRPPLVYCSISGYGQEGPLSDMAGHDINYLAYTGVLQQTVGRDARPILPGLQIADLLGGCQTAVIGILAALLDARTSGHGRALDVSMTDAVFAHNVMGVAAVNATGHSDPAGAGLLTGGVPCYNVYATADGRHLAVGALEAKFWDALCHALDRPDLCAHHWSRGEAPGSAAALAVRNELDALFATRPLADWVSRLAAVDCCVAPVLTTEEALAHPLFRERGMVALVSDAIEGTMSVPTLPLKISEYTFAVRHAPRMPGADNAELLPP